LPRSSRLQQTAAGAGWRALMTATAAINRKWVGGATHRAYYKEEKTH